MRLGEGWKRGRMRAKGRSFSFGYRLNRVTSEHGQPGTVAHATLARKLFVLTSGTEMGGAAAQDDALDGGFAADTGLAFSGINAMQELEAAFFAIGVYVVAQGTAAVV